MSKYFRWQGLAIFNGMLLLIILCYVLLFDSWLKSLLQQQLQEANGAQVDIISVSHNLRPLSVTITGLALTDPQQPLQDRIVINKAIASLAFSPLLMNKVVIDELTVFGLQFNQPRNQPGEVYATQQDTLGTEQEAGSLALPDIDTLLQQVPLKTTQAAQQAQQSYQHHQQQLTSSYADLPDKQRLQEYKQQLQQLRDTDYKNPDALLQAKVTFDQLKQQIKQDKTRLLAFRDQLQQANADTNKHLQALQSAPQQDYQLLKGVVTGEQDAIESVTAAVFGDATAEFSHYLFAAFELIAPLLTQTEQSQKQRQREEGGWIEFGSNSRTPDFWIKQARIILLWQQQQVRSDWQDITYQHSLIGRPTMFDASASAGAIWQSLDLSGNFEFTASGFSADQAWQLDGIKLTENTLSDTPAFNVALQQGLLSSRGNLTVTDNLFNGNSVFQLADLALQTTARSDTGVLVADVLNNLQALSINAVVGGDLQSPLVSLQSDLDRQLAQALVANLSGEQQQKLNELRDKLTARVATPQSESRQQLAQISEWQSLTGNELEDIESLLGQQFESVLDKKKNQLLEKLGKKLLGNSDT